MTDKQQKIEAERFYNPETEKIIELHKKIGDYKWKILSIEDEIVRLKGKCPLIYYRNL